MLKVSERFFLVFVFFILISFFLISKLTSFRKSEKNSDSNSKKSDSSFCCLQEKLTFSIEGQKLSSLYEKNLNLKKNLKEKEENKGQKIFIEITGAVYRPGKYLVSCATPLAVVLQKARLKPFADLAGLNKEQLVGTSCEVHIPFLKEVIVEIEGAVEKNIQLILPVGSRARDLKSFLVLREDADLSFFKSKRLLKNNERIQVPALKK